jgi:hypothetical protein
VDREADRWLHAYRNERIGVASNKSLRQLAEACLEADTERLAQTEGEGQSALI